MITSARAEPLLIGKLAGRTGVNIETIRYYERVGLLPPPPRTKGRHRTYDERVIQRLCFIRRSRELGFPLDAIRTLLQLVDGGNWDCCATKDITLRHLSVVRGELLPVR